MKTQFITGKIFVIILLCLGVVSLQYELLLPKTVNAVFIVPSLIIISSLLIFKRKKNEDNRNKSDDQN